MNQFGCFIKRLISNCETEKVLLVGPSAIELDIELKEIEFIQLNDPSLDNSTHPYDSVSSQTRIPPEKLRVVEVDLQNDFSIPQEFLEDSIVICRDVFDCLPNPHFLIKALADARQHCAYLVITCKDRIRVEGFTLAASEAIPLGNPRWSSEKFFQQLVTNGFPPNIFFGHTSDAGGSNYKNITLAIAGREVEFVQQSAPFKVAAIINLFNEADIIEAVVRHLVSQDVEVHLVDNWSDDGSYELCMTLVEQGLVKQLKRFPDEKSCHYEWALQLQHTVDYASKLDADWIIHYDADEIRCSPWRDLTLNQAVQFVDSLGYNAIDFTVIDFRFTAFNNDELFSQNKFQYFEFNKIEANTKQVKAWKNKRQLVNLHSSGGHEAIFDGRRVYPIKFLIMHYSLRSQHQAQKKIFINRKPRIQKEKAELGWHVHFDQYEHIDFIEPWQESELIAYDRIRFYDEFLIERLSGCGLSTAGGNVLNTSTLRKVGDQLAIYVQNIDMLHDDIRKSDEKIIRLEMELKNVREEIESILMSNSWRVTKPLRETRHHMARIMWRLRHNLQRMLKSFK